MSEAIKILYVEDEPSLGRIVQDSLESRGFDVHLVKDGAHVMTQFRKTEPDLCVLDVMLPNKDGFTLGKEIKAIESSMPIIFLTAKTQTQDLINGFKAGGNDYIKKPFSMEELIVRIHNLLSLTSGASEVQEEHEIKLASFTFIPRKFVLRQGSKEINLSNREAALLKIFATHTNQTVERKQILMEVWQNDSIFNSRTLDVYITKLRGYFKSDPAIKLITLKGVGYCFYVENSNNQI